MIYSTRLSLFITKLNRYYICQMFLDHFCSLQLGMYTLRCTQCCIEFQRTVLEPSPRHLSILVSSLQHTFCLRNQNTALRPRIWSPNVVFRHKPLQEYRYKLLLVLLHRCKPTIMFTIVKKFPHIFHFQKWKIFQNCAFLGKNCQDYHFWGKIEKIG